jgi:hypothetical protein
MIYVSNKLGSGWGYFRFGDFTEFLPDIDENKGSRSKITHELGTLILDRYMG